MVVLEKRLSRPGATIAFGDTESGSPAVVLTHGASLDHTVFEAQARTLQSQGYRVISWDLRGHGLSTLDPEISFRTEDALADLAALVDECGLDQVVLVGHSYGGNLAQAYADTYPDRVAAQFVLATTWKTKPLTIIERLALNLTIPVLRLAPAPVIRHFRVRSLVSRRELRPATHRLLSHIPKHRLVDIWRGAIALLQDSPYRHVPTGLIRDTADPVLTLAAALPGWVQAENLRVHPITGARHLVTWDAPEAVSEALLQLLAEVPNVH